MTFRSDRDILTDTSASQTPDRNQRNVKNFCGWVSVDRETKLTLILTTGTKIFSRLLISNRNRRFTWSFPFLEMSYSCVYFASLSTPLVTQSRWDSDLEAFKSLSNECLLCNIDRSVNHSIIDSNQRFLSYYVDFLSWYCRISRVKLTWISRRSKPIHARSLISGWTIRHFETSASQW